MMIIIPQMMCRIHRRRQKGTTSTTAGAAAQKNNFTTEISSSTTTEQEHRPKLFLLSLRLRFRNFSAFGATLLQQLQEDPVKYVRRRRPDKINVMIRPLVRPLPRNLVL